MKRNKFYDTAHINDDDLDEGPSKSELKRQSTELQELGESLIELSPQELDELDLPEKLRDAVDLAKNIDAHGGLYRQKQFIGKLMRKIDVAPIRAALEAKQQAHRTEVRRFQRVEQWRDRLLNEPAALDALLAEQPDADHNQLQRLIARAQHEAKHQQAPTAARELFTLLRELLG
jgi:ribosome-associated protein